MTKTAFLRCFLLLIAFVGAILGPVQQPARAALQTSPAWWGASAGASSVWHYRVPLTMPAGTPQWATAVVNVNFGTLLTQLGVSGTLDVTSPRVVDASGNVVPTQEFTDSVYNGATDVLGNGQGELRFITPSNATSYWLYFDIMENGGPKGSAGVTPVGGNFEHAVVDSDVTAPAGGWVLARDSDAVDSRVVDGTDRQVGTDGSVVGNGNQPRTVDGSAYTGGYSYLVGARSRNEPGTGTNIVVLTREIRVPSSNPGQLKLRYRVQGWDSGENGVTNNYDYLSISVVRSNGSTTHLVGPSANNYNTYPFSPNRGGQIADNNDSGYGQYNGYDTNIYGGHESNMTSVSRGQERWWERTLNLDTSTYRGQIITLRIATRHTVQYRSWWHLDDIEWSVYTGTVGTTPQGFGAVLQAPTGTPTVYPGQQLQVRARLDATGKAGAVVAKLYRPDGVFLLDVPLYNDGSNGDATADDAVWSANVPVPADIYTLLGATALGTWTVRLVGADGSTPLAGQPAGLVRVVGQGLTPVTGGNFFNADVQTFNLAALSISGRVYIDSNRNGAFNSGEPAAAGMFVKLLQGGVVTQVVTPDGSGAYTINGLGPGTYTVLQSVNNNPADTAPSVPSGSIQSEPAAGASHTVTVAAGSNGTANFGQYPAGAKIGGKVFADNGAGGATALDGVQGAGEAGRPGLTVSLLDALGNTLATAVTQGSGQFEMALPSAAAGTPVTLSIPALTGHDLGRVLAGTTGGTVSLPARTLVFTPAAGTDYGGVVFSLLPVSTLVQGQAKTVPPGGTAAYPHRFDANANGTVSFSLASQPPGSLSQWTALLYRDNDCNGVIDGADTVWSGAMAVQAGGSVCVVVRDLVPQASSVNMANQHQLTASLVVTQGAGFTGAPLFNVDITTVGAETGSGLTLTKAVRNLSTGSAWATAGQALPGQTMQYRLTFRNDTASPVTQVQVNDFVPAYSVFLSAACGPMPPGLSCALTTSPAPNATTGAIQWTFTGAVPPGASGEVTFDWMLMN